MYFLALQLSFTAKNLQIDSLLYIHIFQNT